MMVDVVIRGWVGIQQAVRQGGWAREGGAAVPWREGPDVEKLKSMWLVCRLEQKVDETASRWVCRPRLTSEFEGNG